MGKLFDHGDIVVLKSGGPLMAVLGFADEGIEAVECEWLAEDGSACRAVFPIATLEPLSA
jgi:uncharacterized protein YodC (DUF2158 family)